MQQWLQQYRHDSDTEFAYSVYDSKGEVLWLALSSRLYFSLVVIACASYPSRVDSAMPCYASAFASRHKLAGADLDSLHYPCWPHIPIVSAVVP